MAQIKMYTTPWCPYCVAAKQLFKSKGVDFEDVNVAGNRKMRSWLLDVTGQRTVPQIFINDTSIGGFSDAQALDHSGKLDQLLELQ